MGKQLLAIVCLIAFGSCKKKNHEYLCQCNASGVVYRTNGGEFDLLGGSITYSYMAIGSDLALTSCQQDHNMPRTALNQWGSYEEINCALR